MNIYTDRQRGIEIKYWYFFSEMKNFDRKFQNKSAAHLQISKPHIFGQVGKYEIFRNAGVSQFFSRMPSNAGKYGTKMEIQTLVWRIIRTFRNKTVELFSNSQWIDQVLNFSN